MIRFLFKSTLVVVVVLGIAAAILWWKLDAVLEIARPEIQSRLARALGREVSVGALRATVFPSLRIVATDVVVKPELIADELSGDVALAPLLSGEVKVSSLRLVHPQVSIDSSSRAKGETKGESSTDPSRETSTLSLVLSRLEIVDGMLSFPSQNGPTAISKISMRASGEITPERMEFDKFELSGQEARMGKFELSTRSLRYDVRSELLSLKDGDISLGGVRGQVRGEWAVARSIGDISVALEEFSAEALRSALATISPSVPQLLRSYQIAGMIHPTVKVKGTDSGIVTRMSGSVRNGKGNVLGIPLDNAKCNFELTSEARSTVVRFSEGTFVAGSKRDPLTLSGEYDFASRSGNVQWGASSLSYETLKPVLDLGLPKGLVLSRATSKVESTVSIGKVTTVSADLKLIEVAGVYNKAQFQGVQGPLTVSYSPNTTVLRSSGLRAIVASSPLEAKFSISLPEQSGDLSLEIAPMSVRDIVALGGMAETVWAKDVQGTASGSIQGKFSRGVPSFQGTVNLKEVDLPSVTPPVTGFTSTLRLSPGKEGYVVDSKDLSLELGGELIQGVLKTEISPTDFLLESLALSFAGGKATVSGAIELVGKKRLKLKIDGKNFEAQRVANVLLGAEKVSLQGTVKSVLGEIKGNREGDLFPTLSGPVSFKFTEGVLKGVNLGRIALEKINNLPLIQGRLYDRMSPELKEYFKGEDTIIQDMTGEGQLRTNGLDVRKLSMWSDHYAIEGGGRYDFSSGADMKTVIAFSPGFSSALQKQVYETKQLMDRNGVLVFPLEISGRSSDLSVQPDVKAIVERALSRAFEKKAGQLLENILGPK